MGLSRRRFLVLGLAGGAALALSACSAQPEAHASRRSTLADFTGLRPGAPAVAFPGFVTPELQDAYQFAVDRPDVLRALPCYCGCGLTSGHRSNLDCFVAGVDAEGAVVLDDHGSFCQTCVDIARDAERLVAEGRTLVEIRAHVDAAHGAKGPGTDTPKPAPESGEHGSGRMGT